MSFKVLPSDPVLAFTLYVPGAKGFAKNIEIESKSNPVLHWYEMTLVGEIIFPLGAITLKSEPSAARLLHFIFLFVLILISVPSHGAVAEDRWGSKGSVMLAVPPSKESV